MKWYFFILGLLTVWRVTFLLNAENGPFNILAGFRKKLGTGFFGSLFNCFYCLSIWVSIPFAVWLGSGFTEILLLVFSFSSAAILLERLSGINRINQITHYIEDKEE